MRFYSHSCIALFAVFGTKPSPESTGAPTQKKVPSTCPHGRRAETRLNKATKTAGKEKPKEEVPVTGLRPDRD
jgi:hypothetical protein